MKLALALLFLGAGVTLIYSGLTGEPLTPAIAAVLAGKNPPGKIGKGEVDNPQPGAPVPGYPDAHVPGGSTPDIPAPKGIPGVPLPHSGPGTASFDTGSAGTVQA